MSACPMYLIFSHNEYFPELDSHLYVRELDTKKIILETLNHVSERSLVLAFYRNMRDQLIFDSLYICKFVIPKNKPNLDIQNLMNT